MARKVTFALALVVALGALFAADHFGIFGTAPRADGEKYDGKTFAVVHVVDGDTIDVDIPNGKYKTTRVRLWGVDTPETAKPDTPPQHFGREASEFTKRVCLGKKVRLKLEARKARDKYDRLLAFVYLPDGKMLNRVLIEKGYGYADPRYEHTYAAEFKRLQKAAADSRVGLWQGITNDGLPYYYRDKLKLPQ